MLGAAGVYFSRGENPCARVAEDTVAFRLAKRLPIESCCRRAADSLGRKATGNPASEISMESLMNRLACWETSIVSAGLFIIFIVTFGDYVLKKIGPIIRSWFGR
jgi:hypothetical protein